MREVTRNEIIEAAKHAAEQVEGVISRKEFERITKISNYHVYKNFPEGGWSEVKKLAGLERHPRDKDSLSDEELLEEYHRVATKIGRLPTWTIFGAHANISADVIRRRFGGLQGTLKRYLIWLEANDPSCFLLEELNAKSQHEISPPPVIEGDDSLVNTQWNRADGPVFGAPINFRGLHHAPINELGVVFLFGVVSYELGYIVEAIHAAFPDCEAKRCIDRKRNRWQRVRIEFEYSSRSFLDHGHEPNECDVIVCWEHNWPNCPLEVIELRRVIDELEN